MTSLLPPATYRKYAAEFCRYACGYDKGRGEPDTVYQAVTEGRDRPPYPNSYSSCADLVHAMLYRLGARSPWVNRAENKGWRSTRAHNNITLLQSRKEGPEYGCPEAVSDPAADSKLQPGDACLIWNTGNDAHAFVVLDHPSPSKMLVAEYGQPGGRVRERPVTRVANLMVIGGRALHRVLPLEAIIDGAEQRGELAQAEHVRAWAQRLGLPPPVAGTSDTDPAGRPAIAPPLDPSALPVLRLGSTGEAVRLLQERLKHHGRSVIVDGVFGQNTQAAVRQFQLREQLPVDGVVGAISWGALVKD